MIAIPKPKKINKSVQGPQLTEYDYHEIGEKIGESLEFETGVEIKIFSRKRYETVSGVITNADSQKGVITMRVGYENIKINMNNIVGVK